MATARRGAARRGAIRRGAARRKDARKRRSGSHGATTKKAGTYIRDRNRKSSKLDLCKTACGKAATAKSSGDGPLLIVESFHPTLPKSGLGVREENIKDINNNYMLRAACVRSWRAAPRRVNPDALSRFYRSILKKK
jgi:hypothetical protein